MSARILFANLAVLAFAGLTLAAEPAKSKAEIFQEYAEKFGPPGPEHKFLEPLVGTWNVKMQMWMDPTQPAIESDGLLVRKAILGGRFIQEDYSGSTMGQPYQGIGTMGYDRAKKKFTSTWMDNMSTSMVDYKGKYDEATKTWSFKSDETCPITGKPVQIRDTIQIVSPDEQKMVMYRQMGDEKEMKCMELTITRKK